MSKINHKDILQKAIDVYGFVNQLDMVHEEIGEFMQALNKVKRMGGMLECNNKISRPHKETSRKYSLAYFNLCSEVADMKIMIAQVELMLDQQSIDLSEERKIQRLSDNLNKSKTPV